MISRFSKFRSWILIITTTLMILMPTAILTTRSQPMPAQTTAIYLDPSETTLNTSEVSVGHHFNVTAWVSDVSDLMGFQVALYYNASVINMTSASLASDYVFAGQAGIPLGPSYGYFDSWGYGFVGFSGLGGMTTPFTGTGTLAVFEFEVIAAPPEGRSLTSDLIISYKVAGGTYETKLKDSTAGAISFTAADGHYEYAAPGVPPPEETQLYVDPPEIVLNTDEVSVGHHFNVTAWVSDVSDLMGFQVALYYNASVINMTSASLASDYVFAGQAGIPLGPSYGYFDSWGVGFVGFSGLATTTPFTGTGTLAVFEFEVIAAPPEGSSLTSDLIISYKVAGGTYETKLKDSTGGAISFTAADGHYEYAAPGVPPPPGGTQLYVDPPEIVDPTLLPPATVRINVTINNVTNLYGYEFYLNYDTNMLTCISLTINSVLGETHFTPKISMDDETGTIYVKVSYYEPAEPITTYTPLALVTLIFRVDSLGSSVLDLNNTKLTDPSAQPIDHEAKDGFIGTLIQDLAVLNVTLSENIVYQGWPVNITVTAKNEGDVNETFSINVCYDSTLIENQTVANLAPDQEATLTFTWYTTTVEPYVNHTIKAEIPAAPYEIDTTDNALADGILMVKLMGDINGDQLVDIDDLIIVAQAFGSHEGHPRWNPEADLSRDGVIDIDDVVLAAMNFGKHYP